MTTIIYKDNEFAWDSQTTWLRAHNGASKVFENGGVTFGVAGSSRTSDVLEFMSVPALEDYKPGFNTREWIVTQLVPAIQDSLHEVRALEDDKGLADSGGHMILYVNGLAGYLSGNGAFVSDESGLLGVGSGSDYALGAVKAGATLEEAVKIATELDMHSGGEVKTLEVGNDD